MEQKNGDQQNEALQKADALKEEANEFFKSK